MIGQVNIPAPSNGAAGAPQGKETDIVIFNWDDISAYPARDSGGVMYDGSFVFKAGKYAWKIYATSSSINMPVTTEGDEDAVGFNALPEFSHPGSSLEIEEFMANNINKPLGVAVRVGGCDGGSSYYKVYGTKCNPLSLIPETQDDNEANKNMIKFQQFRKAQVLPGRYSGTWTFDTATTVSADTTDIDVTNGQGEYQLTDNTGATVVSDISNATHGEKYTFIGSGGSNPATFEASNAIFVLAGAVDWSGVSGARLTLQAYEQSGGSFIFFEVSRSS